MSTRGRQDCNVTFVLSKISSDNLMVEEHVTGPTWRCCQKQDIMTGEVLNRLITNIIRYCLTHRSDAYKIHLDRLKGLKLIQKISQHTNYSDFAITQIVALVWASLSLVHHFHLRVITNNTYRSWYRRRQYEIVKLAYERVLMMLLPQLFSTVIKSMMTFFNEAKTWDMEAYVTNCISEILFICKDSEGVLNNLLDIVEVCDGVQEAKNILKIIQNLSPYILWKEVDDYIIFRMLEIYRRSTMNEEFENMKWALESCFEHGFQTMTREILVKLVMSAILCFESSKFIQIAAMIDWVFAMLPGSPLDFANLLENAAGANNKEGYALNLRFKLISRILHLVAMPDACTSLLGCRILFFLLDRQKNYQLLLPCIYFQNSESNLVLGTNDEGDKSFVQDFIRMMHCNLITALMTHSQYKENIEAIFAPIAVLVVELPGGFTAAIAVAFAMTAQEHAIEMCERLGEIGYHIHACVAFIMSLVCHVNDAKVLYDYINMVLGYRAQVAPAMNPPLLNNYNSFPMISNRKELYFDAWECRYGLYQCFAKKLDDEVSKEQHDLPTKVSSTSANNLFQRLNAVFKKKA